MDCKPENTKIAIVASSFPPQISGGISSAHYNLYKILKNIGYNVKCFTYTDHHSNGMVEEDVFRFGSPLILLKLYNLLYKIYLKLLLQLERFDAAYQFPYCLESAVGAWKVGRSLSKFKPDILMLPDYGTPGFFIPKMHGCKTVFISHHNYLRFVDEPLIGKFSRNDARLAHLLEKQSLHKADLVICPSVYMKDVFLNTHTFPGPVLIIPNLVDPVVIESIVPCDVRSKIGLTDGAPVVYIPSAGSAIKGSRFLFEIIRRLAVSYGSDVGFYLSGGIGDEITMNELGFLPSNAKLYNPGRLGYHENIAAIKACDLCVSPTLLESFGMALLEANLCSLPVVAFNAGGASDIVVTDVNGILVDYMDVESLVASSQKLLNDEERLDRLKLTSASFVKSRFSGEVISDFYGKLFSSL